VTQLWKRDACDNHRNDCHHHHGAAMSEPCDLHDGWCLTESHHTPAICLEAARVRIAELEVRIEKLEARSVQANAVAEAAAHYVEAKEDHSPGGYSLVRARFATLQRTLIAFASTGKTPEVGG